MTSGDKDGLKSCCSLEILVNSLKHRKAGCSIYRGLSSSLELMRYWMRAMGLAVYHTLSNLLAPSMPAQKNNSTLIQLWKLFTA